MTRVGAVIMGLLLVALMLACAPVAGAAIAGEHGPPVISAVSDIEAANIQAQFEPAAFILNEDVDVGELVQDLVIRPYIEPAPALIWASEHRRYRRNPLGPKLQVDQRLLA